MAKKRPRDDGTLVYSSGPDGAFSYGPGGKKKEEAGSSARADLAPEDQRPRVTTEASGRGKTVTVVRGLTLTGSSLEKLARELKQACGTGGSMEGGSIVIQGDQKARIVKLLAERGYRTG